MSQTVLTFISPVDPARVDALTSVLATIAADLYTNPYIPFPSLPSLHFASLVVLPRTDRYGPFLVFENNFDGQLDSYLDELVGRTGNGLHAILQHTQDYPRDRPFDAATLRTYLRAHVVRPNAYHVGAVGRSVARIKQQSELRKTLEAWLDELVRRGEAGAAPAALHARIQQFVAAQAAWARTAPPRQTGAEFLLPRLRLGGVVLLALALLPGLLPLGLAWSAILHWKEKHDAVQPAPPNQEHGRSAAREREPHARGAESHGQHHPG